MSARQLEQTDFHWPRGLYESAPFVYLAAGLWLSFRLDGPVAAVASAFLILAGLGILALRWSWRRNRPAGLADATARYAGAWPAVNPPSEEAPYIASYGLVAAARHGDREILGSLLPPLLVRLEAIHAQQEKNLHEGDAALAAARRHEHRMLTARISTLQRGPAAGKPCRQALTEGIVYAALIERKAEGALYFLA